MKRRSAIWLSIAALFAAAAAPSPAPYHSDFHAAAPGKPGDDLMILNGSFAVVEVDHQKCLELAPDPLDGDGLLFGPPGVANGEASGRIRASATGRRFPEFGIGCNDAGGYKLIAVPGQAALELRRGDELKTSAPLTWKSDAWLHLKLSVSNASAKPLVKAKAWLEGTLEPKEWQISFEDEKPIPPGRASAWGMPYSGAPIRFDDLAMQPW